MNPELKDDATTLAGLMSLASPEPATWPSDELPALWRHQLAAPLLPDLPATATAPASAQHIAAGRPASKLTFGDVLKDPAPPLEVLRLIKDFAKTRTTGSDDPVLHEFAIALYYSAIAVALARCDSRITDLTDASLLKGFEWSAARLWLDDDTRAIFADAIKRLTHRDAANS